MKMTPQAEQFLLDEWAHDPFVGNDTNSYNDRLANAIILEGQRKIAKIHGFDTYKQYLSDLNNRVQTWTPPNE